MKFFCDTSVLVAACVRNHPYFNRARPVLEAAKNGAGQFFISSHSVAELYSVLTNLPLQPRIVPSEAKTIIDTNILPYFKCINVTAKMYEEAVMSCVQQGASGGVVYDGLLLCCARAAKADRIYTFNVRDFQRLMPELATIISAP
jgi:predicted nucleic acid-binding protein